MKQLAIGLLFLLPSISFAATVDEQRHALITQLILLIQQEIAVLEAQLASQDPNTPPVPVLGATGTSTDPLPAQITQLANQLQTMPTTKEPLKFAAFQVQGGNQLVIESSKKLDWSKTIFPDGVTITGTTYNASDGPFPPYITQANKFIGEKRGEMLPTFLYDMDLTGIHGPFSVTVEDFDGQSQTVEVNK